MMEKCSLVQFRFSTRGRSMSSIVKLIVLTLVVCYPIAQGTPTSNLNGINDKSSCPDQSESFIILH